MPWSSTRLLRWHLLGQYFGDDLAKVEAKRRWITSILGWLGDIFGSAFRQRPAEPYRRRRGSCFVMALRGGAAVV